MIPEELSKILNTWLLNKIKNTKNIKSINKWLENKCESGHVDIVKIITNFKFITMYQIETLYYACKGGNLEIIKIITKMCKLTNNNKYAHKMWQYSLEGACEGGHLDIVNTYTDQVSLHISNIYYMTKHKHEFFNNFLKNACKSGNMHLVMYIVVFLKNSLKYHFIWDEGMMGGCSGGHLEIVKFIIKKGIRSCNIYEGMLIACKKGYVEIVKFLMSTVKYDIHDSRACECLMAACEGGYTEVIDLFVNSPNNGNNEWNQGLKGACQGNQRAIIELMISKGATDWNAGLIGACTGGNLGIVKFMILKGATDLNSGFNAACKNNCAEVVEYFFNEHNPSQYNFAESLYYACFCDFDEIVKLIVLHDNGHNNGRNNGFNELFSINKATRIACEGKHFEIVKILVGAGGVVNDNCLIDSCKSDNVEFVEFVLKHITTELTVDTLSKALTINIDHHNNTDINILLTKKGGNLNNSYEHQRLKFVDTFEAYQVYYRVNKINILEYTPMCHSFYYNIRDEHVRLLQKYPPYILLVACRISKKCCVNKLPTELFRLLFEY